MKKCIMTESAVEVIHKESTSAFKAGKETGGILMGPAPTDEAVIITSATGPGDGERASSASWETDPGYLNRELKRAREENPGVNLRGFWHRHPGRMTRPSVQDLTEARKILADKEHYKLDGLIMPIVTATRGRIAIHCYYIDYNNPQFREIPMEVLPDGDEMVKSSLSGRRVIEVEGRPDPMFWQDEGWQFYISLYGATRLEDELKDLKRLGYEAEARLLDDGSCFIEAWKGKGHQRVLFLLPREYPLNPPRVFIRRDEDMRELDADSRSPLCRWSSMFNLTEVVESALIKKPHKGEARTGVLVNMREDFRQGNHGIARLAQQLAGLIKGEGKCDW